MAAGMESPSGRAAKRRKLNEPGEPDIDEEVEDEVEEATGTVRLDNLQL